MIRSFTTGCLRAVPVIALALAAITTRASEVEDVLRLWGSQAGPWQGYIDIYGLDSPEPTTVRLTTNWDAVPDSSIVTKIETFSSNDGTMSAVTLMLADGDSGNLLTPYFAAGRQRDYRFAVVSVAVTDPTHWVTVIATPGGQEVYEDRPARLRYVRTREGNTIENTKEVLFLDDASDGEWQLRSHIRQSLE